MDREGGKHVVQNRRVCGGALPCPCDSGGGAKRWRQGIKWHDGKPFTAKDVKCTWEMLIGKSAEKLRLNPRKAWYRNLEEIATEGDDSVTFVLKRPQPAFLFLLSGGMSPVYPCH